MCWGYIKVSEFVLKFQTLGTIKVLTEQRIVSSKVPPLRPSGGRPLSFWFLFSRDVVPMTHISFHILVYPFLHDSVSSDMSCVYIFFVTVSRAQWSTIEFQGTDLSPMVILSQFSKLPSPIHQCWSQLMILHLWSQKLNRSGEGPKSFYVFW